MITKKIKKLKSFTKDQRLIKKSEEVEEEDLSEVDSVEELSVEEKANKPSQEYFSELTFDSLDLSKNLKKAVKMGLKFDRLTKIQAKTIPLILQGKDLIGAAKTGSGKTLAFLLPALQNLNKNNFRNDQGTGVLIITPTRELAQQIYDVTVSLLEYEVRSIGLLIGGADKKLEADRLRRGINILIATPGRLLDHLVNTKDFNHKNLVSLIIDEADQILKFGFEEELNEIISILRDDRQTILFSATQTKKIEDIVRLSIKNPIYIDLKEEASTVDNLEQGFVICDSHLRFRLLLTFLRRNKDKKIMVFFSSCSSVKFHSDILNYVNLKTLDIHGKQKQQKRLKTYYEFSKMQSGVLLCTDVAARGLDIPKVDWIVQFDPPDDVKEYIHRVGRACRGTNSNGKALLLLLPSEIGYLKLLRNGKVVPNEFEFPESKLAPVQGQFEKLVQNNFFLSSAAKEAYRSYLHSYMSHSQKDIFDINEIDLQKASKSFGLIVPPRVDLDVNLKRRKDKMRDKKKNLLDRRYRDKNDKRQFSR